MKHPKRWEAWCGLALLVSAAALAMYSRLPTAQGHETYWRAVEQKGAAAKAQRQKESDDLVTSCLGKKGAAHIDSAGHFSGCTIFPPREP